jgi:serine/threonine protein kinase
MMNRLKHPNIIELFGFGIRANFHHFIVMEFMDSGTLSNSIICFFDQIFMFSCASSTARLVITSSADKFRCAIG